LALPRKASPPREQLPQTRRTRAVKLNAEQLEEGNEDTKPSKTRAGRVLRNGEVAQTQDNNSSAPILAPTKVTQIRSGRRPNRNTNFSEESVSDFLTFFDIIYGSTGYCERSTQRHRGASH
jgi:hypothetical protein